MQLTSRDLVLMKYSTGNFNTFFSFNKTEMKICCPYKINKANYRETNEQRV